MGPGADDVTPLGPGTWDLGKLTLLELGAWSMGIEALSGLAA